MLGSAQTYVMPKRYNPRSVPTVVLAGLTGYPTQRRLPWAAIKRPNKLVEVANPMEAVLDIIVPFSECGESPST